MSDLPFSISLDLALGGSGACPRAAFDAALNAGALDWLRGQARSLELLSIVGETADIDAARGVAAAFTKDTTDVVVLGIGGSSLGGKALLALAGPAAPRVTFCDNPDPDSWSRALAGYDLRTTRFIAISKSGGTAETLMQALTAADAIEKAGGGKYLKHHFAIVTEPKPSPLKAFAEQIGAPVLDHPLGIGGRYSVVSIVGLLPALILGLDVAAFRAGAKAVVDAMLASDGAANSVLAGAALHHALAGQGRMRETVLWCYADRLATLGAWWRQLWAESLGKGGKGSSPVAAVGPVDQHSQLQHFRDGPNDTFYTIVTTDTAGKGPVAPRERADALGLGYLAGRSIGDLVDAEARATAQTLSRNGRPVRTIHVPRIDERAFGGLMMHFMLETILMGRLMGVDPFDQPGVEEGKVLAREYLAQK
ncbi:MAG: glucose-6-phosphate isomerase [Proteobacteria bacterium]|nr:glucose-6-phosphate isomerase [Pseudomonadota bacterium]